MSAVSTSGNPSTGLGQERRAPEKVKNTNEPKFDQAGVEMLVWESQKRSQLADTAGVDPTYVILPNEANYNGQKIGIWVVVGQWVTAI